MPIRIEIAKESEAGTSATANEGSRTEFGGGTAPPKLSSVRLLWAAAPAVIEAELVRQMRAYSLTAAGGDSLETIIGV